LPRPSIPVIRPPAETGRKHEASDMFVTAVHFAWNGSPLRKWRAWPRTARFAEGFIGDGPRDISDFRLSIRSTLNFQAALFQTTALALRAWSVWARRKSLSARPQKHLIRHELARSCAAARGCSPAGIFIQERTHGVGSRDTQDKRAEDIPNSDTGSSTPDTAAPILQSEDDELHDEPHDEDAPE
jgi:hypothetical protein